MLNFFGIYMKTHCFSFIVLMHNDDKCYAVICSGNCYKYTAKPWETKLFSHRFLSGKFEYDLALRVTLFFINIYNLPVFVLVYILIKKPISKQGFYSEIHDIFYYVSLASHTWNQSCIKCSLRDSERRKNKH